MKKYKVTISSLFLLLSYGINSFGQTQEDSNVLYVAGMPVSVVEFKFYMHNNKSKIISIYSQLFNLNPNTADFWEIKGGHNLPCALDSLKSISANQLTEKKAEEILFLKEGLINRIPTFSELELELINTNEERRRKKLNNEIIYGPVEYDLKTLLRLRHLRLSADLRIYYGKKFNIKDHYKLNNKYNEMVYKNQKSSTVKINSEVYNRIKI